MRFSKLVAAVASIGLMASPALAAADSAPAGEIAPASEYVTSDGQQIYGASIILQIGLVVGLALIGYFVAKAISGNGDDEPASP